MTLNKGLEAYACTLQRRHSPPSSSNATQGLGRLKQASEQRIETERCWRGVGRRNDSLDCWCHHSNTCICTSVMLGSSYKQRERAKSEKNAGAAQRGHTGTYPWNGVTRAL